MEWMVEGLRIGIVMMAVALQAGSCVVDEVGEDSWCMLAGSLRLRMHCVA